MTTCRRLGLLLLLAAPGPGCEGAEDRELDAFLGDWQFQHESTKVVTCGKDASTTHDLTGRILNVRNGIDARLSIHGLEVLGSQDLTRFCRALGFSVSGPAAAAVAGQSCDDAQEVNDPGNMQPATLQTRSSYSALAFMHAGLNGGLNASISQHVEELQNGKSIDAFDCQITVNAALKKIAR